MPNCGIMVEAIVLIKTKVGPQQDHVLENLKKINGVNKAYNTMNGTYDFVAEVKTKTIEELRTTVLQSIRKMAAVDSAITLMVAQK